jgi:hypothetical protein
MRFSDKLNNLPKMTTNIGKIHVIFQLITNFILVTKYYHLGFAL